MANSRDAFTSPALRSYPYTAPPCDDVSPPGLRRGVSSPRSPNAQWKNGASPSLPFFFRQAPRQGGGLDPEWGRLTLRVLGWVFPEAGLGLLELWGAWPPVV